LTGVERLEQVERKRAGEINRKLSVSRRWPYGTLTRAMSIAEPVS